MVCECSYGIGIDVCLMLCGAQSCWLWSLMTRVRVYAQLLPYFLLPRGSVFPFVKSRNQTRTLIYYHRVVVQITEWIFAKIWVSWEHSITKSHILSYAYPFWMAQCVGEKRRQDWGPLCVRNTMVCNPWGWGTVVLNNVPPTLNWSVPRRRRKGGKNTENLEQIYSSFILATDFSLSTHSRPRAALKHKEKWTGACFLLRGKELMSRDKSMMLM